MMQHKAFQGTDVEKVSEASHFLFHLRKRRLSERMFVRDKYKPVISFLLFVIEIQISVLFKNIKYLMQIKEI